MSARLRPRLQYILLSLGLWVLANSGSYAHAEEATSASEDPSISVWRLASDEGEYDRAVALSQALDDDSPLAKLIAEARRLELSSDPQWRAFIHYKRTLTKRWLSQVDSPQFFMSDTGKRDPQAELEATLAAFFSTNAKPPLRLTAYCRFVARRYWLEEKLGTAAEWLPKVDCPEFTRYVDYLDADVLTLIFPTAHPNSPSSAFGHTLLRIDKKDQRPESRLLNMSINFAAEVPEGVSSTAYAIKGLAGGFPGKFRLLPYHIKLREYGQIENRDTWEYELALDKPQVDLVLRHAYEMLISHYDYFFFSENCSYHLLSLIEVAYPSSPITTDFGLWTIPVDTIRSLRERGLADDGRFTPSSIRNLRARQCALPANDTALALSALQDGLPVIEPQLNELSPPRQAGVLDLLSDYERYDRLKTDPSAQGSSDKERAILSRRSKLGVRSESPDVTPPASPPDAGHGTARISLEYSSIEDGPESAELLFRPAYHDFRDPSAAFDDKAAIELGVIGIAQNLDTSDAYFSRFTLVSIESIEPRGQFFKPISWHTNVDWIRPDAGARHIFTFNVGAGVAFQASDDSPVLFIFGESDIVDAPALEKRNQLQLGLSFGAHWEPVQKFRTGIEAEFMQQAGGDFYRAQGELWMGYAIGEQLSLNLDASINKVQNQEQQSRLGAGLRFYF